MTISIKPESISNQAELVCGLIDEAIANLKTSASSDARLEEVVRSLHGPEAALRYLVNNPNLPAEDLAESVRKINDTLRESLEALQDPSMSVEVVSGPMESVARSLALLYPLTSAARAPSDVPSQAIRTSFRPRGPSAQNLPAVKVVPPSERPASSPPVAAELSLDERRIAQRINLHTDVSFESESNFYTGFSEDLSDGGIFIATYALRPIGEKIDLSFTLPNGHIVNAHGTVRWIRDTGGEQADAAPGLGVQFEDLSEQDRLAILDFVRNRAPLFYDE